MEDDAAVARVLEIGRDDPPHFQTMQVRIVKDECLTNRVRGVERACRDRYVFLDVPGIDRIRAAGECDEEN